MNIYYVIPDLFKKNFSFMSMLRAIKDKRLLSYLKNNLFEKEKPVGGIKVIYQHVALLRDMGYNAALVSMGKYKGNFFGYKFDPLPYSQVIGKIKCDDVVVIPDMYFYYSRKFKFGTKVLFAQNWSLLYDYDPAAKFLNGGSYKDNSYDYVFSVSDYITSKLVREPAGVVRGINNYIDHEIFTPKPELRVENRIMVMPRKNKKDIASIFDHLNEISSLNYTVFFADGLKESELINEYRKSDIYLATGYPEGFALPPIEAMACGCAVIGFTGGGANEYMINNETALVAEDGDVVTAALQLQRILTDKDLKEYIRVNGINKSKLYTKEKTSSQLQAFYGVMD